MTTEKLLNGQILAKARNNLETVRQSKRISATDKVFAEVLDLIIIFMQEDHPKTATMFAVFKPMAWAMLIVSSSILAALATGHLGIQILVK